MDNIKYPVPKQEYKVLVECFTFNQSKYIEDALNGFAMQQTNFPFVCLVIDDASTDGEQEVIKKWMDCECDTSKAEIIDIPTSVVILVPHKTNNSCTFAFYLLKQNLYKSSEKKILHLAPWREKCDYFAVCEGDDYWIDPLKLQKQFDILENDPTISLCHHDFVELFDGFIRKRNISIPQRQNLVSVARYNYPQTLTMFFRNVKEPLIPAEFAKGRPVYQYFMNVRLAEYGDIYYINEPMGVYRHNVNGIYSLQDKYKKTEMAVINIDRMIEWFKFWHPNDKVVRALKTRARNILFWAFISQLHRMQVKKCAKIVIKFWRYI